MINLPDGFVLLQNHNGKPLYAACLDGGRFHGWLMSKHPDGQWASNRKLESWEVMQAEDQRDDGIIHETGSTTSAKQALYDVVFKAIAAATCVAGNAVSVSVAQFYTALLSRGYTIRAADALDSQPEVKSLGDLLMPKEQRDRILGTNNSLDSQPTDEAGLPPLPDPIEVGGEGWDFEDFQSEKTFSCEHMWAYARAAIASSQPTDGGVRNG